MKKCKIISKNQMSATLEVDGVIFNVGYKKSYNVLLDILNCNTDEIMLPIGEYNGRPFVQSNMNLYKVQKIYDRLNKEDALLDAQLAAIAE
jgi:pyrrolidone-carboxylate peptidase